jgi:hypothetical protein
MSNNNFYKYIGEDKWFIKKGDIIKANPTTWSIPIQNTFDRRELKCIDFEGVGFRGETLSINLDKFIKVDNETYGGSND